MFFKRKKREPPAEPPPTCLDCKHCQVFELDPSWSQCAVSFSEDIVTGKQENMFCQFARFPGKPCGPEGKLFEPKDT